MELIKKLETNRLILRSVKDTDLDDLFNNWSSDSITTKYLTFEPHTSKLQTKKFIENLKKSYNNNDFQWVIEYKENHQAIGIISGTHSYKYKCIELGYSISSKYFNNGLMTEALKKISDYLLYDLNYNVIEAIIPSENIASIRVAQKIGMQLEAPLSNRFISKDNIIQNLLIYSKFSV